MKTAELKKMKLDYAALLKALRKQDRQARLCIEKNYNARWAKDKLNSIRQTQSVVLEELARQDSSIDIRASLLNIRAVR